MPGRVAGSGSRRLDEGATMKPIPLAAGHPVLGAALDLRRDTAGTFLRAQRAYGDVVRFRLGPPGLNKEFVGVFSPEGVRQILGTEATSFRKDNIFYEEVRAAVGNGLLTSQDEDYRRQRRLVQPLFTRERVQSYDTLIVEEAQAAVERWGASPGGVADVFTMANRLILRIVGQILFGEDANAFVDEVRRTFPVINEHARRRAMSPLSVPRSWPTPANRRATAARRDLYTVCDRIIAARRPENTPSERRGEDMLSLLTGQADQETAPTDKELRDQLLVFLLAGHDTTAFALGCSLHLIARHPENQDRAREEIEHVLAGRPPRTGDLAHLPHLTGVVKEVLRLYPPAPVIGRRTAEDVQVQGHPIPAGTDVLVSPWVTHRRFEDWPDPERFDPGRFTPQLEAARARYAWFPFGGGPRACIGQGLAMLELVLILATVLSAFRITAVDEQLRLAQGVTLRSVGPGRCRLTELRGETAA